MCTAAIKEVHSNSGHARFRQANGCTVLGLQIEKEASHMALSNGVGSAHLPRWSLIMN